MAPRGKSDAVAVIGFACKLPGADSLEEYWRILEHGVSMCHELPKDRFPGSRFASRETKQRYQGNTMSDVDAFDHKFFKISSREAKFMDPQQRLALQVTYQALESSGYFNTTIPNAGEGIGCFIGCVENDYLVHGSTHPPSAFSSTGLVRSFIAGRVSHFFGFTGPSVVLDAACASSGVAIHQACRAIAGGECTTAVAGGTNILIVPDGTDHLSAGNFLSTTGQSKSFDAAADGYCRGEGVAVVVLKDLSMALQDGDPIKGIIAATATNHCANEVSITIPHGPSQTRLYHKVLEMADLTPQDVTYIEAHGTGTPVGDPIEAESIRRIFGKDSAHNHEKTFLGSVKSNIGHTEAVSGAAALIKVLLAIQKGTIPQQALFHSLNPNIAPLEPDGLEIPTENISWAPRHKAVCLNNYGASGTNAAMIVTQPPPPASPMQLGRTNIRSFPVEITAFSSSSLSSYCSALLSYMDSSKRVGDDFALDLACHLSRRKNTTLPYSISGLVSSIQQLKELINASVPLEYTMRSLQPPPVVFFFGGQHGDSPSISRELYDCSVIFRKHLDECDAILKELRSLSIFPTVFEPGSRDDLVVTHSILFSIQYATAKTWIDCGIHPDRLVGHSFGQITAICVSGALSLRNALTFVVERSRIIESRWGDDPGAMIAIEIDAAGVESLLLRYSSLKLDIACHNGPQSFVLAGHTSAVDSLQESLKSLREPPRWKRLASTHAYHSALAQPSVQPLQDVARQLTFEESTIPVETCSREGTWSSITPDRLASQLREPVYYQNAVERISEQLGPCTWLETDQGRNAPILRRALGEQARLHEVKSLSLESPSSVTRLAELTLELWNLGHCVEFWPFHRAQQCQYGVLNLPPYQFDKSRHWLEFERAPTIIEAQHSSGEKEPLLQVFHESEDQYHFRINTQCKDWESLCSQRVFDTSVCPLASLLELACHSIKKIDCSSSPETMVSTIKSLVTHRLLPERPSAELQMKVTILGSNTWAFVIAGQDTSHVYTSGIMSTINETGTDFARFERLIDTERIDNLVRDLDADSIKGKAIYKTLTGLFQLPESRRGIKEVSSKGSEAVGYLSRTRTWTEAIENFIHIPMICLNGLKDLPEREIYINTAVGISRFEDKLNVLQSDSDYWALYVRFFALENTDVFCDIFVFDAGSKKLTAAILDVVFTKVRFDSIHEDLKSPSELCRPQLSHNKQTVDVPQTCSSDMTSRDSSSTAGLDVAEALHELLVRVADIDVEEIHSDTNMIELGIDSLLGIEMAEEIDKFFSIKIDRQQYVAAKDFGSLCELIASDATGYISNFHSGQKPLNDTSSTRKSAFWIEPQASQSVDQKTSFRQASLDAVHQAFDSIRDDFDIQAKKSGCDKFCSTVYPQQSGLVVAYICEAFAKMGWDLASIEAGVSIMVPHAPKYDKQIAQFMRALCEDGLVSWTGSEWIRTSKTMLTKPTSKERFDQIQADFPQFSSEHKLLHSVGSILDRCLCGMEDPVALLFGDASKRQLMTDQYTTAPIQAASSLQLCSFLEKCFTLHPKRQIIRVLEIGGGTCGTSAWVLATFAKLGLQVEYTFSDISASFVNAARSKLAAYDFVRYQTLDIIKEPPPELIDSFDLIIATNVIHATPDTTKSASNIRKMLKPSGFLCLVEYTRILYYCDIVFGQLDGWWMFDDGRKHAIMDEIGWKTVLQGAGFDMVDWTGGKSRESEIVRIFLAF